MARRGSVDRGQVVFDGAGKRSSQCALARKYSNAPESSTGSRRRGMIGMVFDPARSTSRITCVERSASWEQITAKTAAPLMPRMIEICPHLPCLDVPRGHPATNAIRFEKVTNSAGCFAVRGTMTDEDLRHSRHRAMTDAATIPSTRVRLKPTDRRKASSGAAALQIVMVNAALTIMVNNPFPRTRPPRRTRPPTSSGRTGVPERGGLQPPRFHFRPLQSHLD